MNKGILNKKKEKFNDAELNLLNYQKALKHDKRNYIQYYFSLLRTKHLLIFSFFTFTDYNLRMIKIYIFFFTFGIEYSISAMFYTEELMHKIYQEEGSFDFIYQIPQMLYSSLLSTMLINIITKFGLCENNILTIKNCKYENIQQTITKQQFLIKVKIILFFVITYILLFAMWIYVGCFCAVYKNTQNHLLKEVLSSFGVSFITPLFINLIPGIFRIPSLKNRSKANRPILYIFSKILQTIL